MSTVAELLDEVEQNSDIDILGITDHDDCRSYAAALAWKASHTDSRVQPVWGVEFEQSWLERTVAPEMGKEGPKKTFRRKLQQQRRSLTEHPREQVQTWVRSRMTPAE